MTPSPSTQSPITAPAYAFAHYGKSLFWDMTELLFAFYLAEIYGIDAATMGILVFVFLVWDALTDPLLGIVLTRRNLSSRRLLKMQLIGAFVTSISFLAVFFRPDWEMTGLTIYALLVGLAFRTAYTVYDVPQNTLLKRLSHSSESRLTLSSLRVAGGALSTITIGFATTSILYTDGVVHHATGFTTFAIIFAAISLTSSSLLFLIRNKIEDESNMEGTLGVIDFKKTLFRSDLTVLFAAVFILSIGWPLFGKLIPFFATYILLIPELSGSLLSIMAISALLCQPIWWWLGQAVTRITLIKSITALTLLSCCCFLVFSTHSVVLAICLVSTMAAVSSAVNMLIWTRLTDRLSEEPDRGVNDILVFGTFTFSSKMGLGIGGLIVGAALTASGYERGETLSDIGQFILISVMTVAPALVTLIATGLMFRETKNHARRTSNKTSF